MASKLQARIDKLEELTAPKPERKYIVRWPGDDDPEPGPGDVRLCWPDNTVIIKVKYADN
jgi:hypothetical protein